MSARTRNALIALAVLVVAPTALIIGWRELREPDLLVSYARTGGFAGANEDLSVYRDGRATLTTEDSTTERELSEDELAALEKVLGAGLWPGGPTVYGPVAADDFQIDIAYEGHFVRTSLLSAPPWLDAIIAGLDALVAEFGG